jgi:glutaredoxin-like YruB-family protein
MAEAAAPVTVYSTSTCPWCDRAKAFLRQHNVPFRDVDVAKDYNAAMEMVRLSGQQGVPVTVADGEVILGFDQARLAKLAAKYSAPKRPPLGILAADAEEYLAKHPEKAEKLPAGTKGVYVGKIRPKTVAERAELHPGDVITSFAGKRVRNMAALDQMVETLKPGDQATAKFLRDGEETSVILQF